MMRSRPTLISLLAVFLSVPACGNNDATTQTATDLRPPGTEAMRGELSALLPDDIREAGVIKAGGPVTQIPAVFLMQDAVTHTGYMIDLANAVGDLLGVEIEFSDMPFTALIPGLQRGVIDMTLVISDKKSQHEILDFVSYRRDGLGILVAAGNPNGFDSLESLCGHTVAVLSGSIAEGVLTEVNKSCADPMEIKVFSGIAYAQLAVRSGQAEATFGGETALNYLSANAEGGTVFEVAPGGPYTVQPDAIAFLKGNDELRDAVQAALQRLVDNGSAIKILEKYGADASSLYDSIAINVAQ